MCKGLTRRDWLVLSGLAAGAMAVRPSEARSAERARAIPENPAAPAEPVSVAKVRNYNEDLTTQFRKMFDQIGGIENQVKGKTVGIKVNLTGDAPFPGYTAGDTHWVHPRVVGAAVAAFGALGAKRIRILESTDSRKPGSQTRRQVARRWLGHRRHPQCGAPCRIRGHQHDRRSQAIFSVEGQKQALRIPGLPDESLL